MDTHKIDKLRIRLWFYRCLYYVHNISAIDDFKYDQLEKELIELELKTKYRIAESPTRRVGYDPPCYLIPLIESLVKTHFKLQQDITVLPKNLKLWSGTRITQMDRMCFSEPDLMQKFSPGYCDRLRKISLEVEQGKYSLIDFPKKETGPVVIPVFVPVVEQIEVEKPKIMPKNGQLSLFG